MYRRTYSVKAQLENRLTAEQQRTVFIADTCAEATIRHINTVRELSPNVTFSFEHPTGIVQTRPWFTDLINLGLRRAQVNRSESRSDRATAPSRTRRPAGIYVQTVQHEAQKNI